MNFIPLVIKCRIWPVSRRLEATFTAYLKFDEAFDHFLRDRIDLVNGLHTRRLAPRVLGETIRTLF